MNRDQCVAFGVRLKEARKACNLSQTAVSGKLKVTRQAVSAWERAEGEPSLSQLYDMAMMFGTPLDWLVFGIKTAPSGSSTFESVFRQRLTTSG